MENDLMIRGMFNLTLPTANTVSPYRHQEPLGLDDGSHNSKKRPRLYASPPKKRVYESDRFIPARSTMDIDYCNLMVTEGQSSLHCKTGNTNHHLPQRTNTELDKQVRYRETLAANLLNTSSPQSKSLLHFHSSSQENTNTLENHPQSPWQLGRLYSPAIMHRSSRYGTSSGLCSGYRHIPLSPTRILDAPELRDDYYLNLVSWGENNVLAVALDQIVYLYNTETGEIHEIKACTTQNDYVTSVAWVKNSDMGCSSSSYGNGEDQLAIGTFKAELQIWDAPTTTQVRLLRGHQERIGALAWNTKHTLASGSRDTKILRHDLRTSQHIISTFTGHHQEICGLAWSPDGKTLASGGNDNCLCLWDSKASGSSISDSVTSPRQRLLQHKAAVKALAWCPWERNLLASGGGTADRTIKFWNSANGRLLSSINTGSQVCGLVWAMTERELLSSHGFSQNELCLWKYPSMVRVCEFTGHTARVLHLAMSPDGSSVVSAAADETLRFWNVFASSKHKKKSGYSDSCLPTAVIR